MQNEMVILSLALYESWPWHHCHDEPLCLVTGVTLIREAES